MRLLNNIPVRPLDNFLLESRWRPELLNDIPVRTNIIMRYLPI